jgi:erythromycin esterase
MIAANVRTGGLTIAVLLTAGLASAEEPNGVRPPANPAEVEAVTAWLKTNAIRYDTERLDDLTDLQPLKTVLKGVRVVGVGETTHGSSEFFRFRHRLLVFLVREMGFRTLAIETGFATARRLDAFIQGTEQDAAKPLAEQGLWTWDTEEMRRILDWLRTYNAGAPARDRVTIVGFDVHYNEPGKREILAYLRRVAPGRVAAAEALFKPEAEKLIETAFFTKDERQRATVLAKVAELRAGYNELLGFLTVNELRFTGETSAAEFARALGYARVLAQLGDACDQPLKDADGALRDYYMAENIKRTVDATPPTAGVVVWAHNGHVSKGKENGTDPFTGFHLRRFFGDAYYALGISFNQGSFQARDYRPTGKRAVMSFTVGPAPEGTVDWYLARPAPGTYLVDFRKPAADDTVKRWLAAPRPMRNIGSYYNADMAKQYFVPVTPGQDYDGIAYFDRTTRARPNPSVENVSDK